MEATLLARRQNQLGEGPMWEERSGRLYWVDIRQQLIEWLDVASGDAGVFKLGVRPSALGVREEGGLVVAADQCVGVLDLETGRFEVRVTFEHERPGNRTNDGGVAADGRFWFGTMDDKGEKRTGALYALAPDWSLRCALDGLGIPNGIVSSADGSQLFLADSSLGVIRVHSLDRETGALSSARDFARVADSAPDGAALDEEGFLWSAQWDGGRVVRYAPDGTIERSVSVPVSRPTSCAFGGAEFTTLFITSARDGLSQALLSKEPLAGSVFSVVAGVRGVRYPRFNG
jgi:sugar lactone lactonase YvrE